MCSSRDPLTEFFCVVYSAPGEVMGCYQPRNIAYIMLTRLTRIASVSHSQNSHVLNFHINREN